jgi:hypothetical protein
LNLSAISFNTFQADAFEGQAQGIYAYQILHNQVYYKYAYSLKSQERIPGNIHSIPFLPISFFKSHQVVCGEQLPEFYFESSGTSGQAASRHYIRDIQLYETSFLCGFERQYGDPKNYCILGLLPSYLERQHSSLVYMVDYLMKRSDRPDNGFYLDNHAELYEQLMWLGKKGEVVILFGTTFALLDFSESYSLPLANTIIIETGGMKGRKKEMIREELAQRLKQSFPHASINSEYGMTELCSQAYADESGIYHCPPWMKVLVRDEDDPLSVHTVGKGALNIIDLANMHSCSFIATDDVGEVFEDGSFKVLGRLDNSDIRGCSLLTV